jgi:hypothetical protein
MIRLPHHQAFEIGLPPYAKRRVKRRKAKEGWINKIKNLFRI